MAASLQNLHKRGQSDPKWFVKEVIGYDLWSKQSQIIESVRDNKRTTVRSCNGAGKSFVAASTIAWAVTNHPESIVITTAPTTRQMEEILWQEIGRIYNKSKFPLGGELFKTKWDFGSKWFALGLSTNDPNRFQGFHAPYILAVLDEACGIEPVIYEAVEAITTSKNSHVLLIGNPTDSDGEFYKSFQSPLYNKIHISAFDTPNFTGELGEKVPGGLVTKEWVNERAADWGEDSAVYRSRVLGEFPDTGVMSMIPLSWIMAAVVADVESKDQPRTMGVDVARFGDDETVVVGRVGNTTPVIRKFSGLDVVKVADAVEDVYNSTGGYEIIAVDAVGIGGGVADILRARGKPAVDIQSGEKAYQSTKYNNKRTEMWYRGRELIRQQDVLIADNEELIGQLAAPRYTFDGAGRYVLETKDQMKKRGLRSPNTADAWIYAYAYDGKYRSRVLYEGMKEKFKSNSYGALLQELNNKEGGDDVWRYLS